MLEGMPTYTIGGTISRGGVEFINTDTSHKWLGPWPNPLPREVSWWRYILCSSQKQGAMMWRTGQLTVTIDNDMVTCPECLEWIHA